MRLLWLSMLMMGACSDSVVQVQNPDTDVLDMTTLDLPDGTRQDAGLDTETSPDMSVSGRILAAEIPPRPALPDRANHLTFTVRTSTIGTAETDSPAQICVNGTNCYRLNIEDINDLENGQVDVYHARDVDLDRAAIDRMTLETNSPQTEDNDRWTPACVDIRVDGEPIYCNDQIPAHIGTGTSRNEVSSWRDPAGLAEKCQTCWPSGLTHGPLLGPSSSTSIRMTVRTDATRLTGLRLGTNPDLSDGVVAAWAWPLPQDDFTADLVVEGLEPGTKYFYRVEVDENIDQPVRAVVTAPAPDSKTRMRIAYGSCSKEIDQPIFSAISATNPDLFLFVGDNNYANTQHRDALRWNYRQFRNVPERANLVANVPSLATWDDHDFLANNSDGTCLNRYEALAAFKEYWANPSYGLPEAPATFFNHRWGAAEFFVLDCRMYRPDVNDPVKRCEPDPNPPNLPRADGPLGPVQEAWLIEKLKASDATFKFMVCGSRMTPEGSLDSWKSFPEAQARLFSAIDTNNIDGVVSLSGDIHRSVFSSLPAPAYAIPELVSSPLAHSRGTCSTTASLDRECYNATDSFVTLDIDSSLDDPTLTARILDDGGRERATWTIRHSELTNR